MTTLFKERLVVHCPAVNTAWKLYIKMCFLIGNNSLKILVVVCYVTEKNESGMSLTCHIKYINSLVKKFQVLPWKSSVTVQ